LARVQPAVRIGLIDHSDALDAGDARVTNFGTFFTRATGQTPDTFRDAQS
jgi:hypothetical protein